MHEKKYCSKFIKVVDIGTIMHVGTHNIKSNYVMADQHIFEVNQQRALAILIPEDLKWRNLVKG